MIDFGKSDKMKKISGKADKPNTANKFSNDISSFGRLYKIKTKKIRCQCLVYPLFHLFFSYIYMYVCVCVCLYVYV